MPERQGSQAFAQRGAGYREVTTRIQVTLAPPRIALNDPTDPQTAQAKCLGEITENRCMRQTGCGLRLDAVINGVIDLVGDKLDTALSAEVMYGLHLAVT